LSREIIEMSEMESIPFRCQTCGVTGVTTSLNVRCPKCGTMGTLVRRVDMGVTPRKNLETEGWAARRFRIALFFTLVGLFGIVTIHTAYSWSLYGPDVMQYFLIFQLGKVGVLTYVYGILFVAFMILAIYDLLDMMKKK